VNFDSGSAVSGGRARDLCQAGDRLGGRYLDLLAIDRDRRLLTDVDRCGRDVVPLDAVGQRDPVRIDDAAAYPVHENRARASRLGRSRQLLGAHHLDVDELDDEETDDREDGEQRHAQAARREP
jgi:hypothetical protein